VADHQDAPEPVAVDGADEAEVTAIRSTLVRAVRRICPAWLADRSDDLVQVAAMRVLSARPPGEGKSPLPASYLYKVAYSALVDEIRRLRRRPEAPLEDEATLGRAAAAPAPDPEREYAATQVGRAIRDCLLGLVTPRRLAVTLHLQGHTVPQAAEVLGWDAKRTENLVYRGLADLRACLARKGVTP
jgi:RNA polymerase sigma-70 factor (ECF subfamily)